MEIKILHVCIGVSSIVSLLLGFYIIIYKPPCEKYHVDEIYRYINDVSSEDGATEIAAAWLGLDYDIESQEVSDYDIEVIFNELSYEWIVIFTPKEAGQDEVKMVAIRRDFGTAGILSERE